MDFEKLGSIIEHYRPLTGLSSLPFAIQQNNECHIGWFNYFLEENEAELTIRIRKIFTLDTSMTIKEIPCEISLVSPIREEDLVEPECDEDEYYLLLPELFTHYSKDKMEALIAKTELHPMVIAYQTAMKQI